MGCPFDSGGANELVLAYSAGTLDAAGAARFELHLETCAKCRELSEAQRKVWSALDAWPAAVPSSDFDQRLFRRIALEQARPWWRRIAVVWSWKPVAPVIVACCALIAAFLVKTPLLNPEPQSQPETVDKIEQVEHQLDDIDMLKQLGVESPSDRGGDQF